MVKYFNLFMLFMKIEAELGRAKACFITQNDPNGRGPTLLLPFLRFSLPDRFAIAFASTSLVSLSPPDRRRLLRSSYSLNLTGGTSSFGFSPVKPSIPSLSTFICFSSKFSSSYALHFGFNGS